MKLIVCRLYSSFLDYQPMEKIGNRNITYALQLIFSIDIRLEKIMSITNM